MSIRTMLSGSACLAIAFACSQAWAASMNATDRQFMATAARLDMTEAHEGQIAETQANRPDVKSLAKTMIQDHTESYAELTGIAAKEGVAIPKGIDAGRDTTIRQLVHLKGARFDRQFAADEVAAYRHAIAVFKREAERGQDPALKSYASKMTPILERHLQLAEGCAKAAPHA